MRVEHAQHLLADLVELVGQLIPGRVDDRAVPEEQPDEGSQVVDTRLGERLGVGRDLQECVCLRRRGQLRLGDDPPSVAIPEQVVRPAREAVRSNPRLVDEPDARIAQECEDLLVVEPARIDDALADLVRQTVGDLRLVLPPQGAETLSHLVRGRVQRLTPAQKDVRGDEQTELAVAPGAQVMCGDHRGSGDSAEQGVMHGSDPRRRHRRRRTVA